MPGVQASGSIQDSLFGALAVRHHFVLQDQVQEALDIQRQLQDTGQQAPRLGEILMQRGYITNAQVQAVLKGQLSNEARLFGEIAAALQFCAASEVEAALAVQAQIKACGSAQRIGEILVARGALRPHQVHAVLKEQGKAIVTCPGCQMRLNVSGVSPGASVSCPRCKTVFRTPSGSDSAIAQTQGDDVRVEMSGILPAVGDGAPKSGGISRLANAVIGPYQIGEKLGSDSSGVLYKALDPRTGTMVALRMLSPAMTGSRESRDLWVSAGEAASALDHPNLQRILSIASDSGRVYLVMEFVEADSLRKSLAKRGKFPVLEAIDVLIQMAEALAYGHGQGFLHGDLRPAHLLIGYDGIVRISGLGTPKNVAQNLRQVAQQLGEESLPLYTPPEVIIDAENADERSDIYGLGAIGYQLLCARPPYEGQHVLQVGLKVASDKLVSPRALEAQLPPFIDRLICKCLSPEPDERYESAAALLEDLRKARQAILSGASDAPEIAAQQAKMPPRMGMTSRQLKVSRGKGRLRTHGARRGHSSPQLDAVKFKGRSSAGNLPAVKNESPAPPLSRATGGLATSARPAASGEAVDLLGDIDPLAVEPTRVSAQPGDEEEDLDAELEAEQRRRKKKEGPPLDPGVNPKWILIGSGVVVFLVIVLFIVASFSKQPAVVAAPAPKPEAAPAVVSAPVANVAASSEWRLIQEYIRTNGQDHFGIVERLESFKLKYVDVSNPCEQAAAANDQLKSYCHSGAEASLAELRGAMQKFIAGDKFSEADKAVEKWKEQWRWDPETAPTAKGLLDEIAKKQKQIAENRMNEAMKLRREKKWDEADKIYKGIAENFASAYATKARQAKLDSVLEADATRGEAEREAKAKREADAKAARDAAAPVRLEKLAGDLDEGLKSFDLEQCKRLLDDGYEVLSGTPQGPDFQALKGDIQHLTDLRDRIIKTFKAGKFVAPKVAYRGQQYDVVEFKDRGPVVLVGTGKVPVAWSDISPDNIAEIAFKATDANNGTEMLELGMLRYHLGRYREARQSLSKAQGLGAVVSRYLPKVEAKVKDAAPQAAPTPAPAAVPAAAPAQPAAVVENSDKALAAKGLEVNRGVWKVTAEGAMLCLPDPTNENPLLMSLKHAITKNFKRISIEFRGTGESAGFSFGADRRFVAKPADKWQKITVERGGKVEMKVDEKAADSLDPVGKEVNADNLVTEGLFYIRFKGAKGEFRNLEIVE